MKNTIVFLFLILVSYSSFGQQVTEEAKIQQTIETFFEGFHARDSVMMKTTLDERVVVQTIGKAKSGELQLHHEKISEVLKGIVSIPSEMTYKEVLHGYEIKIDGAMANVWTPYSFFLNGKFSHCGVNSFQLFQKEGSWKIIYLIDTRRREGCDQKQQP